MNKSNGKKGISKYIDFSGSVYLCRHRRSLEPNQIDFIYFSTIINATNSLPSLFKSTYSHQTFCFIRSIFCFALFSCVVRCFRCCCSFLFLVGSCVCLSSFFLFVLFYMVRFFFVKNGVHQTISPQITYLNWFRLFLW